MELSAQQQPAQNNQMVIQDLNEASDMNQQVQFDLNEPTPDINQDLHPVIFNPVVPEGQKEGEGSGQELHLLQLHGEVFFNEPNCRGDFAA
jgi:hypothetical protein